MYTTVVELVKATQFFWSLGIVGIMLLLVHYWGAKKERDEKRLKNQNNK